MRYLLVLLLLVACTPTGTLDGLTLEEHTALGNPDAPVIFVEFSDYECPFCKKFTTEALPEIKEEYINTGEVRFYFKDFPLEIHQHGREAAIAARCAGEQGMFWEYHDHLFENSRDLSDENFILWAREFGMDETAFSACVKDPATSALLNRDIAEAKAAGVGGTPTLLINGRLVTGAQPFAAFQQIIEEELDRVVTLAQVENATCYTDDDCPEGRAFDPYCSRANDALCVTTGTPTCKLGGTAESACVTIISETCTPCDGGCENSTCTPAGENGKEK